MKTIIAYILNNKEWIFSGVGVAIIIGLFTLFRKEKTVSQKQKSGNNSLNIQIGGNLNLNKKNKKDA